MKRLQEQEARFDNQGISKFNYGDICNESINPWVPMRKYPCKLEITKIEKFKSK